MEAFFLLINSSWARLAGLLLTGIAALVLGFRFANYYRWVPRPLDKSVPHVHVQRSSRLALPKHLALTSVPPVRPIYAVSFWGGFGTRVVISSQVAAVDLYSKESQLERPRDFGFGWPLEAVLGNSLFVHTGAEWRALLSLVKDPFASSIAKLGHGAAVTRAVVDAFVVDLIAQLSAPAESVVLDPDRLLQPPFVSVINLLYGSLSPALMRQMEAFRQEMDEITMGTFSVLGSHSLFRHLPSGLSRRIATFQRGWRDFHRALPASADGTFVKSLADGVAAGKLSESQMLDTLNEIVLANADFVAAAVAWPLVHLAQHPAAMARVRTEIAPILPDDPADLLTTLNGMEYLDAVIQESWRLEPMLFVTNPVLPSRNTEVAGYRIRAQTPVVVDAKAVNRDPAVWGPTADMFDPTRFLPGAPVRPRHSLQVFGLGQRKCLGQHLAKVTVKLMLVALLAQLDVRVTPQPPSRDNYGPFQFPPFVIRVSKLS
jgi:cytochrome P450